MSLKKTAKVDAPHAVFKADGWEWRVLKVYSKPANEAKDRFARWFVATKSPFTYGSWEYGDGYAVEIRGNAVLTAATDEWKAAYPNDVVRES